MNAMKKSSRRRRLRRRGSSADTDPALLRNITRSVKVWIDREFLTVEYWPFRIRSAPQLTARREGGEDVIRAAVVQVVARWDLLSDGGGVLPLTVDALKAVPYPLMVEMYRQILQDARLYLKQIDALSTSSPKPAAVLPHEAASREPRLQ